MKKRAKKLRERIFIKKCPLYEWAGLRLVLTNNVDESSEKRGAQKGDSAQARTMFERGGWFTVILSGAPTAGDVAHESVHVAMQILHASGVRFMACQTDGLSTKNDEALAYLVGWIVEWIFSRLSKTAG